MSYGESAYHYTGTIMRNKGIILIIIPIFLVLLILADIYIFINRHDGYNYRFVDYKSFYYLDDQPGIAAFDIEEDSLLTVRFYNLSDNQWSVTIDSGQQYISNETSPVIRLKENEHAYMIKTLSKETFPVILKIAYTPKTVYENANNPTSSAIHIIHSSIPMGTPSAYSRDDFTYNVNHYDPDDVKRGYEILDSIGIDRSDLTERKIIKLGNFIILALKNLDGIPSGEISSLSPLRQFEIASKGKSPIWCSNYQKIYTFFATLAGIPTRMVETKGELDGVILSAHAFAESYIVGKSQWAYIDLSSRKIFVRNNNGDYMNTLDLYHAILAENLSGLKVVAVDDSLLIDADYSEFATTEKYYFTRDAVLLFPRPMKIVRPLTARITGYLFGSDLAYALSMSNIKIKLKLILFYLTVMVTIYWLIMLIVILKAEKGRNT
jgi:hypothetical protein